jgi:hypothetical protein
MRLATIHHCYVRENLNMEKNLALILLRILRREMKGKPMSDSEVRKKTGFDQVQLDLAAEELEAEGMLVIERTYVLVED